MVTSPYEWKILEWDENPQTTKTSEPSFEQMESLHKDAL